VAKIEKQGDKVTLEMSWEEYRDLCETLTAAGNEAWHHRNCDMRTSDPELIKMHSKFRADHAQAAWEWTNAIGFPPLLKDEVREVKIEPFKFLSGK
jgi:hypothetical protein